MNKKQLTTWSVRLGSLSLVAGMISYLTLTDGGAPQNQQPVQPPDSNTASTNQQQGTDGSSNVNGMGRGHRSHNQMQGDFNSNNSTTNGSGNTNSNGSEWVPNGSNPDSSSSSTNQVPDNGGNSFDSGNSFNSNDSFGPMQGANGGHDTTTGGS